MDCATRRRGKGSKSGADHSRWPGLGRSGLGDYDHAAAGKRERLAVVAVGADRGEARCEEPLMKLGEGKCPHTEVVPLHLTVPNGDPLSVGTGGRDVKGGAVDHQIISALGQDG